MRKSVILLSVFLGLNFALKAQTNCSINAGATENYCSGDKIKLRGAISGQFDINTVIWELISAPPGADVQIEEASSVNTRTNTLTIPGEYQFQISSVCDIGVANQTVTHILNPSGEGRLIFPDLYCHPENMPFWVRKEIGPGNFFIYDFEIDGLFRIIEHQADSIRLRINGCYTEEFYYPKYRVSTLSGCTVQKEDTLQTVIIYKNEVNIIPPGNGECWNLQGYCPGIGIPKWTILTEPTGSDATLSNPNSQNTFLCDFVEGGIYEFEYSVDGIDCIQSTAVLGDTIQPVGCRAGDTLWLGNIDYTYCPGFMPSTLLIQYPNEDLNVPDLYQWTQTAGPEVELIGTNTSDLTVNGLNSNVLYVFTIEVFDTETGCLRIQDFIVFEQDLYPDIEFFIRDESFQFCTSFQSCNNQYIFEDKNNNQYNAVDMQVELLSHPPNEDLSIPFSMNFDTPGIGSVPLFFYDQQRINNFYFQNLRLSNGYLSFYLCSDVSPGNYSFRITLSNNCFEYEQEIVLSTYSGFNKILPNAGTDQILPCMQDFTTVVGNELGWDDLVTYGFWTALEFPDGSSNPVPNIIQDQFLELQDLDVGKYVFRYYYAYNDLSVSQNICEYENRFDDVIVIVSDDDLPEIDQVANQLFCVVDEYCIQVPIDDGGSSTSIEQTEGPTIEIPIIEAGGILCFDDLEAGTTYEFNYVIDNGCSLYSQAFEIKIANSAISPAIVLTEDICVSGTIDDEHELEAADIQDGMGEWTYIGSGEASFLPSPFVPNVTAIITNGVSYPVYREFIWTVTNEECETINQDKVIIKNNGYVPIDVEKLFINCNADYPYEILIEPSPAPEGVEVSWEILSSSSIDPPNIKDTDNDTTSIEFLSDGTFILELKYAFDGDCGEAEEIAQIEVRLSSSEVVAFAGEDIIGCSPDFTISAIDPSPNNGFWAIESTNPPGLNVVIDDAQNNDTSISFEEQGNVILSWNILADDPSCGVVAQDDIQISWQEFQLNTTDLALCNESTAILEHSPINDANIDWTIINGPNMDVFIGSLSSTTTLFSNLVEGVYTIGYSYNSGNPDCDGSGTIQIAILGAENVESYQSYCELNGNSLENIGLDFDIPDFNLAEVILLDYPFGALEGIAPIINSDNETFNYSGFNIPGIYIFQLTGSSMSCEVNASLQIEIGGAPVIEPLTLEPFCSGEDIVLDLGVAGNLFFMWSPPELFEDPNSPIPIFIGTESTTISYTVSTSESFDECFTTGEIDIVINNLDATITPAQVICEIEEVTVEIFSNNEALEIIWSDSNGEGLGIGNSISFTPSEDMLISAAITDVYGCELELSTTVEISPLVYGISATADPSLIELGENTQLNVNLNSGELDDCNIQWTPTESLNDPTTQSPTASPTSNTNYSVNIEKDGCQAFAEVEVEVDNSCLLKEYYIPNMFTPNDDGHNDCFQVYGNMEDFEMIIYDRWGEEIIVITETNECWDGSYKSQDLPPDVYAYYVKHIRCDGEELEFRGNVTLIK